jgi:putative sterol carrier protein
VGHAEHADVTLTTDYDTAKRMLLAVDDPTAGLQAFMEGKVKVQGDMAKLMATQAAGAQGNRALSEAIQAITE